MKFITHTALSAVLAIAFVAGTMAQNSEGHIEYEEVIKIKIELPPEMMAYADQLPNEQKTNMALSFTANESLYRESAKATAVPPQQELSDGGVDIEMNTIVIGGGGGTETYYNLTDKAGVRQEDMMGKLFLVETGAHDFDWKIANEQRTILGYTCMKATTMRDGNEVVAWFTPQIPVSTGPAGYGGLPGVILAMDMPREGGGVTIAATEVNLEALKQPIEVPKKGKKVTAAEFDEIVERQMQEMRDMHGGEGGDGNFIKIEVDVD